MFPTQTRATLPRNFTSAQPQRVNLGALWGRMGFRTSRGYNVDSSRSPVPGGPTVKAVTGWLTRVVDAGLTKSQQLREKKPLKGKTAPFLPPRRQEFPSQRKTCEITVKSSRQGLARGKQRISHYFPLSRAFQGLEEEKSLPRSRPEGMAGSKPQLGSHPDTSPAS